MSTINNIPSVSGFKKSVGRYYTVQKMMKKKDDGLYAIFRALEDAQAFRQVVSQAAHDRLRILRRACAAWLYPPSFYDVPEEPAVKQLAENVHVRIQAIITQLHRGRTGLLRDLTRQEVGKARDKNMILKRGGVHLGKAVDAHYDMERFTRRHVPVIYRAEYNQYLTKFPMTNLGVEDFVELIINPLREDDPHQVIRTNLPPHNRVIYCNEQERRRYKLSLRGDGLLRRADGELLDTSGMQSITTGPGWGIFVVDLNQDFYVNAHVKDHFHHSSFLSGEPVFSAGEVCVSEGVLVGVTNKTGHYKAGPAELHRALVLLQKSIPSKGWQGGIGAGMEKVAVSDPFLGGTKWISAQEVIAARGDVSSPSLSKAKSMAPPSATNMATLADAVRPLLIF